MTRILLVRHGQSEWNADGRWQGWADAPLSDLGRAQAAAAARRIGTVDAVVASDLQRAIDTAAIIGEHIGVGPVAVEPGLKERDVGEWTGLTKREIEEHWPGMLASFSGPVEAPGGEKHPQFVSRITAAIRRVAQTHEGAEVLVVSHGGVIRSLDRHLGIEPDPIPNLAGRWISVEDGKIVAGDRVMLLDPDDVTVTVPLQL
jgi:broad specificity phosphatase PhoE